MTARLESFVSKNIRKPAAIKAVGKNMIVDR